MPIGRQDLARGCPLCFRGVTPEPLKEHTMTTAVQPWIVRTDDPVPMPHMWAGAHAVRPSGWGPQR